jgi:Tfp pilus assembly major pilin PilA
VPLSGTLTELPGSACDCAMKVYRNVEVKLHVVTIKAKTNNLKKLLKHIFLTVSW